MKISNNFAGNYNPFSYNNVNKTQHTPKAQQSQQVQQAQKAPEDDKKLVTNDEKSFFAKMYPDKSSEIQGYHFYGRNGQMSGLTVGSRFDRRG